jgi:hypothetical protein
MAKAPKVAPTSPGVPSVPAVQAMEQVRMPTPIKSKVSKAFKKIKEPIPRFMESVNQIQGYWAEGEFDLVPIFKLLDQEAFFFKACQKKLGQMFKSGVNPRSDDDKINEYLQARFLTMELQTGFALEDILKQAAYHLIIGSNAFIIKVRDKDFEYASSYKIDGKEIAPVVGLFIAHPTSMKPRFKWVTFQSQGQKRSKLILVKWIFVNRRGVIVEFEPEDVCHFTLFKQEGMIFGTPEVIPVIDDIATLRKMEEDVQLLAYRDLFPIIHYTVENPAILDHDMGVTELDQAKRDLEKMMQDGGIATDSRHKIAYVGSQGKSMDIKPYLEYFMNRVFSGLGVSQTDFGLGADISGTTAQSMSSQLVDSVRHIQQEFTRQFDSMILNEIMLHSPFGINGLKEGFRPTLKFEEIDIEWQIRKENHAADQFTKGVMTIDEVRNPRGLKTLDQNSEKRTQMHMYGDLNPAVLAQEQEKLDQSAAKADLIKKNKTNSNTTKSTRKKSKSHKDSADFLIEDEQNLAVMFKDAVDNIKSEHPIGKKFNLKLYTKFVYAKLKDRVEQKFADGITDAILDTGHEDFDFKNASYLLDGILDKITKLGDDVTNRIAENFDYSMQASSRVRIADRTEQVRAYNYAYAAVCQDAGITTFSIRSYDSEDYTENITITDSIETCIPPFHPNSKQIIKVAE